MIRVIRWIIIFNQKIINQISFIPFVNKIFLYTFKYGTKCLNIIKIKDKCSILQVKESQQKRLTMLTLFL